jgi:hypothetical protein
MPVDVGPPFGSPISLAPLTFNHPAGGLKLAAPGQDGPGAIDALVPDTRPRGLDGQRIKPRKTRRPSTSGGIALVPARYRGNMTRSQPATRTQASRMRCSASAGKLPRSSR